MTESRIVPAEGPSDSRIVLIGECPGATEDREGRPFVGGAGKILDALLEDAGIKRSECYITNVVQRRPHANNFNVFYERRKEGGKVRTFPTAELSAAIDRLLGEIQSVRPNVIVPLGNEALKAVLPDLGSIVDWRGSILETRFGKVIPTYHPAAVMRQWNWRAVALMDFERIAEQSRFPDVRRRPRELVIAWSQDEAIAELHKLARSPRISFDIECALGQINAIGFAAGPERAVSIPFWFGEQGSFWSEAEEVELWELIRAILEDPASEKIAQNGQFDMAVLTDTLGIEVRNLWLDTLVAQHTAYPELPVGLDFLCSIYTDQPYYKYQIDAEDAETFFRYNATDACVTFEIAEALERELQDLGLWDFYRSHSHRLIEPLLAMARRGVRIDTDVRDEEAVRLRRSIAEREKQLIEEVGHSINSSSNKQMCEWLYGELKLPPVRRRRATGPATPSADDEALADLAAKHRIPAIQTVLEIREAEKLLSTYLTPPLSLDGRFRASYKIHGTETGRLSSGKYVDGTGGNIQNVPKGICRRIFVPEPGNLFVEADLSQAEARVVAYLADEERLIKSFAEGGDIHRRNAAAMYQKPESEISFDERQLAKRAVHGLNYGMGVATFAKNCKISVAEARRVRNLYFSLFPGIEMWQRKVAFELRRSRTMTTPFGRKRIFLGAYSESLIKEALAFVPQSTVADITNAALIKLHSTLPAGSRVAITVHDSIVVECPEGMAEEIRQRVVAAMTWPLKIGRRELVIPVDSKIMRNWDEEANHDKGDARMQMPQVPGDLQEVHAEAQRGAPQAQQDLPEGPRPEMAGAAALGEGA